MSDYSEDYAFYPSDCSEEEEDAGEFSDGIADVEDPLDVSSIWKRTYRILEPGEVQSERENAVMHVTSILGVNPELTVRMLRLFKWDTTRTTESWFEDPIELKEKVGYCDGSTSGVSPSSSGNQTKCLACFEMFNPRDITFLPCGHGMCADCWRGFICAAVESGPACLTQRCPIPGCNQYIPVTVVEKHGGGKAVSRWHEFDMRSFVDDNPSMAWCTAPNCSRVVECKVDLEPHQPLDVRCKCGNVFCFNCKEEAHTPVDCETVKAWQAKNSAESENLNYILVNTKPCPQCKRPIEKNQGCMHMMCSQCRHEFCWLCMGKWSLHNEGTGGFYACNRFEAARKRGDYDEETRRRENAKAMLERYTHYYERWALHNTSHKKAIEDQNKEAAASDDSTMGKLSKMSKFPEGDLTFILGAWKQVVECRRILKYSYAYGYYKFESKDDPDSEAFGNLERKKAFFEFLQGDAEASLERLHSMVEKELNKMISDSKIDEHFQDFRKKLIGLTDVTRDYFEKLVKQLEAGFERIEEAYAPGGDNEIFSGQSSSHHPSVWGTQMGAASDEKLHNKPDQVAEVPADSRHLEDMAGFWQCPVCTYANEDLEAEECAMCQNPRP